MTTQSESSFDPELNSLARFAGNGRTEIYFSLLDEMHREPVRTVMALVGQARLLMADSPADSLRLLTIADAHLAEERDSLPLATLRQAIFQRASWAHYELCNTREFLAYSQQALKLAEAHSAPRLVQLALINAGLAHLDVADIDTGVVLLDRAVQLSAELPATSTALMLLSRVHLADNRIDDALALGLQAISLLDDDFERAHEYQAQVANMLALAHEVDEAKRTLGHVQWSDQTSRLTILNKAEADFVIAMHEGERTEAARVLGRAMGVATDHHLLRARERLQSLRAWLLLSEGRHRSVWDMAPQNLDRSLIGTSLYQRARYAIQAAEKLGKWNEAAILDQRLDQVLHPATSRLELEGNDSGRPIVGRAAVMAYGVGSLGRRLSDIQWSARPAAGSGRSSQEGPDRQTIDRFVHWMETTYDAVVPSIGTAWHHGSPRHEAGLPGPLADLVYNGHYAHGRYQAARAELDRVLDRQPLAVGYMLRALVNRRIGNLSDLGVDLVRATTTTQSNSDRTLVITLVGHLMAACGRHDLAEQCWRTALAHGHLSPTDEQDTKACLRFLSLARKSNSQEPTYEELNGEGTTPLAQAVALAGRCLQSGSPRPAAEALSRRRDAPAPWKLPLLYCCAVLARRGGDLISARELLEEASDLSETPATSVIHFEVAEHLAEVLTEQGESRRAMTLRRSRKVPSAIDLLDGAYFAYLFSLIQQAKADETRSSLPPLESFRGAVHDIRATLQILYLSDAVTDPEVRHRSVDQAMTQARSLLYELDPATARDTRLELVSVRSIVQEVIDNQSPAAIGKGQRLVLSLGPEDPKVVADRGQVWRILQNLMSNAVKFSEPNTTITATLDLYPDPDPDPGMPDTRAGHTGRPGRWVRFQVADEGPGIPPDQIPRLFQPNTVLAARPTGGEASTGMGLWSAKTAADQLGGHIWAKNNADRGATFIVELPLAEGD